MAACVRHALPVCEGRTPGIMSLFPFIPAEAFLLNAQWRRANAA
jgi:hypothetical protein